MSQAPDPPAAPETTRAPAREDPPAPPDPPARPDPPAPAPADPPAEPAVAALPAQLLEQAALEQVAALADSAVEPPGPSAEPPDAELPSPETPAPAPAAPGPGNLNVSIRIFSPGDDGPVTQVVGGGGGGAQAPSGSAAPTTWNWNWNWNWSGSSGCHPGSAAPSPGVAGWNWSWTWTCGAADPVGVPLPDGGSLPEMLPPAIAESLDDVAALPLLPELQDVGLPLGPAITGLPALGLPAPTKTVADAPESRAGRERPGFSARLLAHGGPGVRVQAFPVAPVAPAALPPESARKLAPARRNGRDIKRDRGLIPASNGSAGPSVAFASAAGAAGASSGPALLTTLLLALLSFFASALLAGAGLPRLKPRASRLERPG